MNEAVIEIPGVSSPLKVLTMDLAPQAGSGTSILRSAYVFLRKWPPILAAVLGWTQLHAGEVIKVREFSSVSLSIPHITVFLALLAMWNAAFFGRFTDGRNTPRLQFLRSQTLAVLLGSVGCALELWLGRHVFPAINLQAISISVFLLRSVLMGAGLVLLTTAIYEMAYQLSTPKLCVIVGTRRRAVNVYKSLKSHRERRNIILGFVDQDASHAKYLPCDYLGGVDDLERILMKNPVEIVCFALPMQSQYGSIQEIVYICERIGVPYEFSTGMFRSELGEAAIAAGLRPSRRMMGGARERDVFKRMIDLIGAVCLLVIFSPLFLIVALAIKLNTPGPVFFKQRRCGRNRRCFNMYKFRSMVQNAEALQNQLEHRNEQTGPLFKLKNDPRVTSVGRVLRILSLDELPQLINVLRGEMSLVGPRPLSLRDLERISDAYVMRRFSVTPGMTGLWQVSGRSNTDFNTLVQLDLQYVDRWSLRLDLHILLRTLPAVLYARGAA